MSHIIHHFKDRHSDHTPTWTWEDDGVGSYDPLYAMGLVEPNYPVPALRTDNLYWRMPSYPTENLIAQWSLTGPGQGARS
jgi:hypothetical protein